MILNTIRTLLVYEAAVLQAAASCSGPWGDECNPLTCCPQAAGGNWDKSTQWSLKAGAHATCVPLESLHLLLNALRAPGSECSVLHPLFLVTLRCPTVLRLFSPHLQGGVDLLIVGLLQGLLSYPFFDPVRLSFYAAAYFGTYMFLCRSSVASRFRC